VRYLGIPASGVTTTAYRTQTEFTATAGQTTFSVPSYTVGYIDVYRNGLLLGSTDFTATNGTTVVLAAAASAGDFVETVSFYVSSVLNAIPNSASSVQTSNIADSAITTAKIAAGAVAQVDLATNVAGTGPAFSVYQGTQQSVTSGVYTKIAYTVENFDTANCFDSTTNYRFTPTVAGYYQINQVMYGIGTSMNYLQSAIYKNGVIYANTLSAPQAATNSAGMISILVYMNGSTDYIEGYGLVSASSSPIIGATGATYLVQMSGYLARAA
jgi:hypothetical protein